MKRQEKIWYEKVIYILQYLKAEQKQKPVSFYFFSGAVFIPRRTERGR